MYKSRLKRWNVHRNKKRSEGRTGDELREQLGCPLSNAWQDTFDNDSERWTNLLPSSVTDSGISDMSFIDQTVSTHLAGHHVANTSNSLQRSIDHSQVLQDDWCIVASDGTSTEGSRDIQLANFASDSSVESGSAEDGPRTSGAQTGAHRISATGPLIPTTSNNGNYRPQHVDLWLADAVNTTKSDPWIVISSQPSVPRMPDVPPDPEDFVDSCVMFCKLGDLKKYDAADASADWAFRIYGQLLKQQHKHALTSLNTVLCMFLMYDRSSEAIELMGRAKGTAQSVLLIPTHPIVQTIDFLMFQAAGDYVTMQASQLRQGYAQLCATFGFRHPYSLLTGYLLAWRLATNDQDDMSQLQSLQLLCRIQLTSDRDLGTDHLLSIAILLTKARVQHSLQMLPDAASNLSEAIGRMDRKYSSRHPYVFEAKSRYADILYAAYRDDDAEIEYLESALGRVELFGKEHPIAEDAVNELRSFYATTRRHAQSSVFEEQVMLKNQKFLERLLRRQNIVVGRPDR